MPPDTLTPDEIAAVTGKRRAASQAADLARRGIAYRFTGARVVVERAVAVAYDLVPESRPRAPRICLRI